MRIYDEQILKALTLLQGERGENLEGIEPLWQEAGKQNLVLRGEMAYELGGGALPAVSFLGVTSSKDLVPTGGGRLYGRDLGEISTDTPYARITLLRIDEDLMGKGEAIYDNMVHLINTRYNVNPKGFMSRISTSSNQEPVRVSKAALKEGLTFSHVARLYLEAYKTHKQVIEAQVIFVTLPNFDYRELASLAEKNKEITKALDHILREVKMDCSSCKLKFICSEVEGLKETLQK